MEKWIVGPELYWICLYLVTKWLVYRNASPPNPHDKLLERYFLLVPLAAIISFTLYWCPMVDKEWLLLRIWVSGIGLGSWIMLTGSEGYSKQGPGIGMGCLGGVSFLVAVLIAGTVIYWIKYLTGMYL